MSKFTTLLAFALVFIVTQVSAQIITQPPGETGKGAVRIQGQDPVTGPTPYFLKINPDGSINASTVTSNVQGLPNAGGAQSWHVRDDNWQTDFDPWKVWADVNLSTRASEATLGTLNGKVVHVDTGAVVVSSSALPTGAATSANQTNGTQVTQVSNFPVTQPVSGTVTAVQASGANLHVNVDSAPTTAVTGTFFQATQPVSGTFFQATQPVSGTFFQATQPVSAASLPLPTGAATAANQTTANASLSSIDGKLTSPLAVNSTLQAGAATVGKVDQGVGGVSAWKVDGSAVTQPVSNASLPLPAGASTSANQTTAITNQTNGTQKTQIVDGSGNVQTSTTVSGKVGSSVQITGADSLAISGSGSALNNTPITDTTVSNYRCISVQHALTGTNTITFEQSNDDVNFVATQCSSAATANVSPVSTTAAAGLFYCPLFASHFRTRISAFTSGTSTDTAVAFPGTCDSLNQKDVAVIGTATVSGTVNVNPAVAVFSTQVASAARTTSGNSGTLTQAAPNNAAIFEVNVTAVSGTSPTLDLVFQESYDNGTTWTDEWHWERITTSTQISTPLFVTGTGKFRFVWTLGGTTPSFTFSIGGTQGTNNGQWIRRFFDRTIDPNTTNSTTAAFNGDGCKSYNFTASVSACTLFPTFALQLSEDGVNYATTSDTLPLVTNGTFISSTFVSASKFVRLVASTGGTTCVLGFTALRCTQY